MRNSGQAPKMVVWIICVALYVLALLAYFGVLKVSAPLASGSWIVGFGLLILACRIRGL